MIVSRLNDSNVCTNNDNFCGTVRLLCNVPCAVCSKQLVCSFGNKIFTLLHHLIISSAPPQSAYHRCSEKVPDILRIYKDNSSEENKKKKQEEKKQEQVVINRSFHNSHLTNVQRRFPAGLLLFAGLLFDHVQLAWLLLLLYVIVWIISEIKFCVLQGKATLNLVRPLSRSNRYDRRSIRGTSEDSPFLVIVDASG